MSALRAQLAAIRANAQAISAQADAILVALGQDVVERRDMGSCRHLPEQRTPTPRMGCPDAWRCACGVEGDGETVTALMEA